MFQLDVSWTEIKKWCRQIASSDFFDFFLSLKICSNNILYNCFRPQCYIYNKKQIEMAADMFVCTEFWVLIKAQNDRDSASQLSKCFVDFVCSWKTTYLLIKKKVLLNNKWYWKSLMKPTVQFQFQMNFIL